MHYLTFDSKNCIFSTLCYHVVQKVYTLQKKNCHPESMHQIAKNIKKEQHVDYLLESQ